MFIYPYNKHVQEVHSSVLNLLHSSISSKDISESCDISYTTISELRNGKRDLEATTFRIIHKLYNLAVEKELNEEFIELQNKKGTYNVIPIEIPIKKIIVAFENLDLFGLGLLIPENSIPLISKTPNQIEPIYLPNSGVIVDQYDRPYDAQRLGLSFNVRYAGQGPNTFVRFLERYSKISIKELQAIIFTEGIVEYSFDNDTLNPIASNLPEIPFKLFKKNGKLIITVTASNSIRPSSDDIYIHEDDESKIKAIAEEIIAFMKIMKETYQFSTSPVAIHYISEQAKEKEDYSTNPNGRRAFYKNDYYHIIFEFLNFEIWLPYTLAITKGNPFKYPAFQKLFNLLNIFLNEERRGFFQTALNRRIEDKEQLTSIRSLYF